MSQTFRLTEILDIARRDGKVSVEGLAGHFGVTLQTIRRDLTELSDQGRLERVHGGAVLRWSDRRSPEAQFFPLATNSLLMHPQGMFLYQDATPTVFN